ncbi:MAG: glycosyltransferase N-terminal domain-containing protein [Planctomycetota bacterium]|nr:glycosyltransferase N-terminal domain-containing protein [Planctomycetota bacterium]
MNALDFVYIPLAIATAPVWAGKKRSGWAERFGKVPAIAPTGRPRLLLHAVSVGEVSALRELVPLLTARCEVVVSATTDTGLRRARELFAGAAHVVRYPLDFSWSVRRFLDAVRPDAVGLVELEVWPNFMDACAARGIPVGVINGRLSARSYKGYAKIRGFMARRLGRLEFAAVQDVDYAGRFQALGVLPERCRVTGSMKWDAAKIEDGPVAGAGALAREMGIDPERLLIVAGSTGPGEESLLHECCPAGVQLLCAPRKPERFNEAAAAMPGCVRRSRRGTPTLGADRFLLDSIGELRQAYSLADIAVVGRSFMGDLFGSDPVEPVSLGKATVMGPYVSDFEQTVSELDRRGGIERADRGTLRSVMGRLLANPERRREVARRGREAIEANQGASRVHAEMLLGLVRGRAAEAEGERGAPAAAYGV